MDLTFNEENYIWADGHLKFRGETFKTSPKAVFITQIKGKLMFKK